MQLQRYHRGVSLLRELAEEGASLLTPGGSLVVVMSSLCDGIARPWLDAKWRVETLATLDVPLKVYAVTSDLTLHDPPRD